MATTGKWNVGGFNIPDYGISEKLGLNKKSSVLGQSTSSRAVSAPKSTPVNPFKSTASSPIYSNTAASSAPQVSRSAQSDNGNNDGGDNDISSGTRDLQNSISSDWDQYIRGLDDQLGGLNTSRVAQENIVNSQYNQGVNTLGLQRDQGLQELDQDRTAAMQNQTSNLRDIAGNIRNAFQAGNVYLGARGASDSSAANQYSYALNKMGTQQRSDVMNNTANILADVDARESNLNNIYSTEVNNLGEQKNQQIQQVGMWFADAQNQIRQMQAEGRLSKSQDLNNLSKDLLNQAIARVNQIEQMAINRKQALDQWAMGVSENIGQLRNNMKSVADFSFQAPQAQRIAGAPQIDSSGNMMTNFGGGGSRAYGDDRDKFQLLFG